MGVRKTESRLPAGAQPTDLGEPAVTSDGRAVLISFITSPLAANRENIYVVFVLDPMLATMVTGYQWFFTIPPNPMEVKTSNFGVMQYTPAAEGYLHVKLQLVGSGGLLAQLELTQQVGPPSTALEALIAAAGEKPGAGMGNPDVLREVVNDHNPYYMDIAPATPETGDAFSKFLFSTVNDGALETKQEKRNDQLEQVAASINDGEGDFAAAIGTGLGVTKLRLPLLAMMFTPSVLPFTELPAPGAENAAADEQLRQQFAALSEEDRIDWFNRVRFPKSNISLCAKLLEALRDKFFPGVLFEDVLKKMSGSMSDWIMLNYNRGPLQRN